MATGGTAVGPAALFGVPGYSRRFESKENNDQLVTALSQTVQSTVTGMLPFKQSDVVLGWELEIIITNTVVPGTQTVTASPYFPYNFAGPINLNFQNQYNAIQALSGIDLALWQVIRPQRQTDLTALYTSFNSMYSPETNLVSAGNYTSASATINLRLELPAGVWFDAFYPLGPDGSVMGPPVRAFVSPQYMAGTARLVQPQITYNPAFVATADNGPYTISGSATTPATFAGSVNMRVKRRGYFQPVGVADSPPVFNWQYTRRSAPQTLAGVTQKDLLVPLNGQIMSIFVRLFDPSANGGVGAPIALSALKEVDFLFGTGLYRYQDYPFDNQARFLGLRYVMPTKGVVIWDFALDEYGRVTNADLPNTMNTAALTIHLEFNSAQSATAYAVIGVEALTYIELS